MLRNVTRRGVICLFVLIWWKNGRKPCEQIVNFKIAGLSFCERVILEGKFGRENCKYCVNKKEIAITTGVPRERVALTISFFYYRSRCKDIFRCLFLKIPQPLNGLAFTVQYNVNHERNISVLVIPLESLAVIAVLMDGDGKQTVIDELLI